MKKFGINTASNIAAKLWSMVSIYIFIPLYIKYLGETSYGLVSVFATLQSTLNILGMGLANTLRREFAAGDSSTDNNTRKYKLLRSTELVYFVIALTIICICTLGSSFIANDWLNIENLDSSLVSRVIGLMGISIALQLICHLYSGCIFGLEKQVLANIYLIVWSILKSVGSLLVIWLIGPNLELFYLWHIVSDIIYLITLRISLKVLCPTEEKWTFQDIYNLKSIWKYTAGILIISLISLTNRQLDKIIISKYLTLTDLGAYNVATTLGSLTSIVPSAVYISIFPRFTSLATTGQSESLQQVFISVNKMVNLVLSSMGTFIAVFSVPLIYLWTHSTIYIDVLGFVGTLVVLAVGILEYQQIPYALALAHGNTKINIVVGLIFLPIVFISTYFGISRFGLVGAGVVYLVMMVGQTLLYQFLVCKTYAPMHLTSIIIRDTVLPFVISVIIAYLSKSIIESFVKSTVVECALAVIIGGCTLLILSVIFISKTDISLIKAGE